MSNHTESNVPDNADEAKGRAKQAVGDLTDDQSMKREGRQDETAGDVKSKVDGLADKAKDAIDNVKRRLSN